MNAYMAKSMSDEVRHIEGIASRLKKLVRRLEKFSFPIVAQSLAGLLTRPENHVATARIEAIIHLAALTCRGTATPTRPQIREWLNVIAFKDPITQFEDPVEDVFVSNVITWFGNARLFDGNWNDNDHNVQTCLNALSSIIDRPWANDAQRCVIGMLRISDAVAERAGVVRNTLADSRPKQSVNITASTVELSAVHVSFSDADIAEMGVSPADLYPFVFQTEHVAALVEETLGHTALERRPLVRHKGQIIVALPTAAGAAIRRFVIEQALEADDLKALQAAIAEEQVRNVHLLGCSKWGIQTSNMPEPAGLEGVMDSVGVFDDGGYVHLIFVADDLAQTAREGLQSIQSIEGLIDVRVNDLATTLAAKSDYRRGLTLLVHGGIGRGFSVGFSEPPPGWHHLCLPISDFMLLGSESEFTALRAWKLREQEEELAKRGIYISNVNNFPNYYEFRRKNDFEVMLENSTPDFILLATNFIASLRHRLRVALDRHAVISPDRTSWIEVQRQGTEALFREAQDLPIYISPRHEALGKLLACTETSARAWWIQCDDSPNADRHRRIVAMVWDMTLTWLVRLAPLLEEELPTLSPTPITYCLVFPDIEGFKDEFTFAKDPPSAPLVEVREGKVLISCSATYLQSFADEQNVGERLMLAALVHGAHMLCDVPVPHEKTMGSLVQAVVQSDDARFIHMTPAKTAGDVLVNAISPQEPRFIPPEDLAWSRLDLAREAGWTLPPGPIPEAQACEILNRAVDAVWKRIKVRLLTLDRVSVIERSLLNFEAIWWERREWSISAAALFAISEDAEDVVQTANKREAQRDISGLTSRVIAEMALCTSPIQGGAACTGADLDFLTAEAATLLECAAQSDALHYSLTASPPIVHSNGSFGFGQSTGEMVGPYLAAHGKKIFQEAADNYGLAFVREDEAKDVDGVFDEAFKSEFGIDIEQCCAFVSHLTKHSLEHRTTYFRLRRSEVIRRLSEAGAPHPARAFEAFALSPRRKWDESNPKNAKKRDWYPWRYDRRLSITRRPLVQLSTDEDPDVLVMPMLFDRTLRYLYQALFGGLPGNLFDSEKMTSWIGHAADLNGHNFARRVSERLKGLRWEVKQELSLSRLGGDTELGDIDVLAWQPDTGVTYAIECKSLIFDRTIGEIGERLTEYASGTIDDHRTPIQKHLDRISYLDFNPHRLIELTNIPVERLQLRSALVTEQLVPMQFFGDAQETLDLVTDYSSLDESFGRL